MATEALQKQTSAALTFAIQPERFLSECEAFLLTMQEAYRSKMADSEQELWIRALTQGTEKFSIQEMTAALDEIVKNPPLYEVPGPDGPITQKWRGMPKVTDLIETMLSLRDERKRKVVRQRQEKERQEWKQMEERRRKHPEEFFGNANLAKDVERLLGARGMPKVDVAMTDRVDRYGLPEVEAVSPILSNEELARRRLERMKQQFAEHQQKKTEQT